MTTPRLNYLWLPMGWTTYLWLPMVWTTYGYPWVELLMTTHGLNYLWLRMGWTTYDYPLVELLMTTHERSWGSRTCLHKVTRPSVGAAVDGSTPTRQPHQQDSTSAAAPAWHQHQKSHQHCCRSDTQDWVLVITELNPQYLVDSIGFIVWFSFTRTALNNIIENSKCVCSDKDWISVSNEGN